MLQQVRVGGCSCVGNGMVRGMVIYGGCASVPQDKIRLIGLPRIYLLSIPNILPSIGPYLQYGVDSGGCEGRSR